MLIPGKPSQLRLSVTNANCHYDKCLHTKCHYAKCHYAKCHYAKCHYKLFYYVKVHYAKCHYFENLPVYIGIENKSGPPNWKAWNNVLKLFYGRKQRMLKIS